MAESGEQKSPGGENEEDNGSKPEAKERSLTQSAQPAGDTANTNVQIPNTKRKLPQTPYTEESSRTDENTASGNSERDPKHEKAQGASGKFVMDKKVFFEETKNDADRDVPTQKAYRHLKKKEVYSKAEDSSNKTEETEDIKNKLATSLDSSGNTNSGFLKSYVLVEHSDAEAHVSSGEADVSSGEGDHSDNFAVPKPDIEEADTQEHKAGMTNPENGREADGTAETLKNTKGEKRGEKVPGVNKNQNGKPEAHVSSGEADVSSGEGDHSDNFAVPKPDIEEADTQEHKAGMTNPENGREADGTAETLKNTKGEKRKEKVPGVNKNQNGKPEAHVSSGEADVSSGEGVHSDNFAVPKPDIEEADTQEHKAGMTNPENGREADGTAETLKNTKGEKRKEKVPGVNKNQNGKPDADGLSGEGNQSDFPTVPKSDTKEVDTREYKAGMTNPGNGREADDTAETLENEKKNHEKRARKIPCVNKNQNVKLGNGMNMYRNNLSEPDMDNTNKQEVEELSEVCDETALENDSFPAGSSSSSSIEKLSENETENGDLDESPKIDFHMSSMTYLPVAAEQNKNNEVAASLNQPEETPDNVPAETNAAGESCMTEVLGEEQSKPDCNKTETSHSNGQDEGSESVISSQLGCGPTDTALRDRLAENPVSSQLQSTGQKKEELTQCLGNKINVKESQKVRATSPKVEDHLPCSELEKDKNTDNLTFNTVGKSEKGIDDKSMVDDLQLRLEKLNLNETKEKPVQSTSSSEPYGSDVNKTDIGDPDPALRESLKGQSKKEDEERMSPLPSPRQTVATNRSNSQLQSQEKVEGKSTQEAGSCETDKEVEFKNTKGGEKNLEDKPPIPPPRGKRKNDQHKMKHTEHISETEAQTEECSDFPGNSHSVIQTTCKEELCNTTHGTVVKIVQKRAVFLKQMEQQSFKEYWDKTYPSVDIKKYVCSNDTVEIALQSSDDMEDAFDWIYNYPCFEISFKDVTNAAHVERQTLILMLHDAISSILENEKGVCDINEKTERIGVCSSKKNTAEKLIQKIKKCIKFRTIERGENEQAFDDQLVQSLKGSFVESGKQYVSFALESENTLVIYALKNRLEECHEEVKAWLQKKNTQPFGKGEGASLASPAAPKLGSQQSSEKVNSSVEIRSPIMLDLVRKLQSCKRFCFGETVEVAQKEELGFSISGPKDKVKAVTDKLNVITENVRMLSIDLEMEKENVSSFGEILHKLELKLPIIVNKGNTTEHTPANFSDIKTQQQRKLKWVFPNGHTVRLAEMCNVQEKKANVVFLEETKESAEFIIENNYQVDFTLLVPTWQAGRMKEKDTVQTRFKALLDRCFRHSVHHVDVCIDNTLGSWKKDRFVKQLLVPLKEVLQGKHPCVCVCINSKDQKICDAILIACRYAFFGGRKFPYKNVDMPYIDMTNSLKFGTLRLRAEKGSFNEIDSDCILCLNEKSCISKGHETKSGSLTTSVCSKLGMEVVFVDMDDKQSIASALKNKLKSALSKKKKLVAIYIDSEHPFLKLKDSMDVICGVVADIAPVVHHNADVSVVIDGPYFEKAKQFFAANSQTANNGEGATTDRIVIKVVGLLNDVLAAVEELRKQEGVHLAEIFCVQDASEELKLSVATSNLEKSDAVETKSSDPSLSAEKKDPLLQWNGDMLQDVKDLECYVEMQNIEDGETSDTLLLKFVRLKLRIYNPSLVYCDGEHTAILICNSVEEADYLSKYKETPFRFRRMQKQCLSAITFKLDARVWNIAKRSVNFNNFLDKLKEIHVAVIDEDIPEIKSATIYQMKCARAMLAKFDTQEVTKVSKEQGGKNVVLENVSSDVWSIVSEQAKDDIRLIENDFGKFQYSQEEMTLTIPVYDGHIACTVIDKVKTMIELFKSKDIMEIPVNIKTVGDKLKDKFTGRCKDVEEAIGYPCLVLLNEGEKLLAFADNYDKLLTIKHQVFIKFEKTKTTSRFRSKTATDNQEKGSSTSTGISHQISDHVSETNSSLEHHEKYILNNIDVHVYQADILKVKVDSIVNAANANLSHGGGVAAVIARAAGERLTEEGYQFISDNGPLPVGHACTTSAGNLKYRCVIHTVGPKWSDYSPHVEEDIKRLENDLNSAISSCFREAEKKQLKKIAIPAVSSAIFGVPAEICVNQYARATIDYCKKAQDSPDALSEIHFIDVNLDIVKKIQDIFNILVRDGKQSPYNRNKYVKKKSRRLFSQEVSTEADAVRLPELLYYEEDWRRIVFCALQECKVKIIYKQDMFEENASAVVVSINREGKGGALFQTVFNKMPVTGSKRVNSELKKRLSYGSKVGQVEVVEGYSGGFPLILFVVFPHLKSKAQINDELMHAYQNVLMAAKKTPRIKSVVTTLFGIDQRQDEDLELGAQAFLSSYISYCEKVHYGQAHFDVKIICNTEHAHDVVCSVFKRYIQLQKSEENVDSTENTSDEKQVNENREIDQNTILTKLAEKRNFIAELHQFFQAIPRSWKQVMNTEESSMTKSSQNDSKGFEEETCVICMDEISDPKLLKCGHRFCTECIEQQFKFKQQCPTCFSVCGEITGDQPGGSMTVDRRRNGNLEGYYGTGIIAMTYNFPNGVQKDNHPNPGKFYRGITRTAYLPDNAEGRNVAAMLKIAFKRKLVFTIGSSRTTGQEGVITWNDIHHKTDLRPHSQFGYPDPTYLDRVTEELAAKGVTEKDVASKGPINLFETIYVD